MKRSNTLNLGITSVTERVRGPKGELVYYQADGTLAATGESALEFQAVGSTVYDMIRERLGSAPRKEILLFVHGVKTSFDNALYTTAEQLHRYNDATQVLTDRSLESWAELLTTPDWDMSGSLAMRFVADTIQSGFPAVLQS